MARGNESASTDTTDELAADGSKLFGALVKAGVSPDEAHAASQEVLDMAGRNMIVPLPAQIDSLKVETFTEINALKVATAGQISALKVETPAQIDAVKANISAQINAVKVETSAKLDALRVETSIRLDSHAKQLAIVRWMLIATLSLLSAATALGAYKTFFDAPRTVLVAAPDAASASAAAPDEATAAEPSSDAPTRSRS